MQLKEAPENRRDAKGAETDQFESPANLSLKGNRFDPHSLALFSALFASLRFLCACAG